MNELMPRQAKVLKVEEQTPIEKLLQLDVFLNHKPGQFMEVSLAGVGEAPVSICSSPTRKPTEICVRKVGRVTNALHRLSPGDKVGVRGPYGNGFPMEKMKGHDLVLVSGGLGIAPLRSVLQYALDHRKDYKEVTLLYGIRDYSLMLFKDEIVKLMNSKECTVYLSYEKEDEVCRKFKKECPERVCEGVVTKLFEMFDLNPEAYAVVCGPPVMYRFVFKEFMNRNFPPERIYMTMERRMKCGIGKCRHCVIGAGTAMRYACKDGPVFTGVDALLLKGLIE